MCQPEDENNRLKKIVTDLSPDKAMLRDVLKRNPSGSTALAIA